MRNVQILLLVLILCSCAGDKESRKIRRKSKIINDSEILIQAGSDGAASYITFKLRENRFFTIEEVVMFWWDYYAGTWEISGDTLRLHYINDHKRDDLLYSAVIDTAENVIILPRRDSLYSMRLEIKLNNFKD